MGRAALDDEAPTDATAGRATPRSIALNSAAIDTVQGIAQDIAQYGLGHALPREHVTIRLDVEPGSAGATTYGIFASLAGDRMIG